MFAKLKKLAVLAGLVLAPATVIAAPYPTPAGPLLVNGSVYNVNVNSAGNRPATISFDLLGYNSLDGNNGWRDDFSLLLNGQVVYQASFALGGGFGTTPVFVVNNSAGLSHGPITPPPPPSGGPNWVGGVVTLSGVINLLQGPNTIGFQYSPVGPNNGGSQSLGDEGWGVRNLNVSPVPVPPALLLFATGLVGAAAMRRRNARKSS
jgi:hypothetical protein